jgi:hypothetical protein
MSPLSCNKDLVGGRFRREKTSGGAGRSYPLPPSSAQTPLTYLRHVYALNYRASQILVAASHVSRAAANLEAPMDGWRLGVDTYPCG